MEVKIKTENGYVDADWTIEDGVMVVSQKEVKFKPKDGDVIVSGGDTRFVAIFKRMKEEYSFYYYALLALSGDKRPQIDSWASFMSVRPATEEEKQKLFDKLADEGLAWDSEKKEFIKLKWKPKEGEEYWYPWDYGIGYEPCSTYFSDRCRNDVKRVDKGWAFGSMKECQEFCNRLNDAISQVKP